MTLRLTGVQVFPYDPEFSFPLVLYPGDAYKAETEPLWIHDVTCSTLPSIPLNAGKYTISLTGHVTKSGHRFSLRSDDPNFETVKIYVSFQLLEEHGEVVKFDLDNSLWGNE